MANAVIVRRDGIRTVTVTASDYSFAAPDMIPVGLTEVRLLNRGAEMHHAMLVRLEAGKTMGDLFAAMQPDSPPPVWAHDAGGPQTPGPRGESNAILRLVAGRCAMICVIPSPDGKPHVMKGMAKEIIVTPATSNTSNANVRVNSTMTLFDYAFQLSAAAGRPPDHSRKEHGRAVTRGRHHQAATGEEAGGHARLDGEDGRAAARCADRRDDADGTR